MVIRHNLINLNLLCWKSWKPERRAEGDHYDLSRLNQNIHLQCSRVACMRLAIAFAVKCGRRASPGSPFVPGCFRNAFGISDDLIRTRTSTAECAWHVVREFAWHVVGKFAWHVVGEFAWHVGRSVSWWVGWLRWSWCCSFPVC